MEASSRSAQTSSQMFARWDEVERSIAEIATDVLTGDDPACPATDWQIKWAEEIGRRIAADVMNGLDGYMPEDIASLPAEGHNDEEASHRG